MEWKIDTARLTEALKRRAYETIDKRNPGSRWRCTVPRALLGDEDGNEEEERARRTSPAQSTFPSRGARVSIGTLILAGPRMGASWDEATCRSNKVSLVPHLSSHRRRARVGLQKMHPGTQPLSRRAHSYGILALCFSTPVILADDYIVGMLAGPQPRTESRGDARAPRCIAFLMIDWRELYCISKFNAR